MRGHVHRLEATIPILAMCLVTSCVFRTPTFTARTPSLSSGSAPPGDPPSEPIDDNQVIEAGCTFNASQIKGEPGSLHQVVCPPGCDKKAVVFGTDVYTSDTPICAAAMHAGAISDRGGAMTVMLEPGRLAYRGSKRHGVESRDWGTYRASYRFHGVMAAPPPDIVKAPVIIEAGCSFDGNTLNADTGTVHRVSCPAGCAEARPPIWGTDVYSNSTPICAAAVHAGLISDAGGEFTLVVEPGRRAYRGSKRNGIESRDWGADRASVRFQR
jgi:LCCL domain